MRQIKFRALDKDTNKLVYLDSSSKTTFGFYGDCIRWDFCYTDFDKESDVFQQATGLKDKNGREIYEGDIVRIPDYLRTGYKGEKCLREIFWMESEPSFGERVTFLSGVDDAPQEHIWQGISSADKYEIVGNIFETPDLLKN